MPALALASLLASIVIAGAGPGASPPATGPLLERLQAKMDRLTSLKGRFVQRLETRLGRPRIERGTFFIKKPSLMRWEYTDPEVKLAVTDGVETWLYLPEDHEVHHGVMPEGGEGAVARLLAGRLRLDEGFRARRLTPEEAGPQGVVGAVVLRLEPKEVHEEFDHLILTIEPAVLQIRRATLVDAVGGRMTFEFFDLQEDPPLDDDLFEFEVPRGAEVIDLR